jgi:hypothetical protein
MSESSAIPELRDSPNNVAYGINENWFNWALEYAFELGKRANIQPESASRIVVQSLAGRNAIKIIRTQVNGLTERISIDGVSTKLMELYEEVRQLRQDIRKDYHPGPKVTQVEYEG